MQEASETHRIRQDRRKETGVILTKTISLTKGYEAICDDEDYEMLVGYKWYSSTSFGITYAKHMLPTINGKRGEERMHQLIMGTRNTEYVDHIDGNGLNNQKNNLRVCTHRENCMNRHPRKLGKTSSKYPGVTWNKRSQKWNAQAQIDGVHKHIGTYSNEEDAYAAYLAFVQPIELKRSEINSTPSIFMATEIENYVHSH